jgi:hypothetical protein
MSTYVFYAGCLGKAIFMQGGEELLIGAPSQILRSTEWWRVDEGLFLPALVFRDCLTRTGVRL